MARPKDAKLFAPLPEASRTLRPGSLRRPGLRQSESCWVSAVENRHVVFASTMTLLVAVAHFAGSLPATLELTLLVVMISILGIPHGALDHLPGRFLLEGSFGRAWWLPFGIAYLALAAVVVAAWLIAPLPTLVGFLAVSAWHFGSGDVKASLALGAGTKRAALGATLEAVARGSLIFVPLLHLHPESTSQLFACLVPLTSDTIIDSIVAVSPHLFLLGGAAFAVVMAHHLGGWAEGRPGHGGVALELASLAALFCLAEPLIAFTVYFCLWHSFRHSLSQAFRLDPSSPRAAFRAFVRHAWPMSVAAFLLAAAAFVVAGVEASAERVVWVVFVGLSALTAPHIVVNSLADRANLVGGRA